MFYIIDKNNYPLSCFAINTCNRQLKFRKNDCITYSTEQEAKKHLVYIQQNCKQQKLAASLRVSTICKVRF